MFTVYNVGMIYFDGCRVKDKRALIPNGTEGDAKNGIPPHYASIFVGAHRVDLDKTNWWFGSKYEREVTFVNFEGKETTTQVYEFRIKTPSDVTFSDRGDGKGAEFKDLEKLPKLQTDPKFELDIDPDTIADVSIRGGTLEPFVLSEVPIVRWTVDKHATPIRITARDEAGFEYHVTLKEKENNVEMVLSNTPDFFSLLAAPAERGLGGSHSPSARAAGAECKESNGGHKDHKDHDHEDHDHKDQRSSKAGKKGGEKKGGDGAGNAAHRNHGPFEHGSIYGKLNKGRRAVGLANGRPAGLTPLETNRGYLKFLATSEKYKESDCTPTCCA